MSVRKDRAVRRAHLVAAVFALIAFAPLASAVTPGTGITQVWKTTGFGQGIGVGGMEHADLDGDGRSEAIFSSITGYSYPNWTTAWSVLEYVPAKHRYQIRWQSPAYPNQIGALKVFPGASGPQVFVGLADGTVDIFDGQTLTRTGSFNAGGSAITGLAMGDADNDGKSDLVVVHSSSTQLFDPASHALRRTVAYGGASFGLGDVDGNGRLDLVYNTGYVITQRGTTTTVKWNNSANGFGNHLALADIDGDGKPEVVFDLGWQHIRAVDADIHSVKWEANTDQDIGNLRMLDVTGDGKPELIYGDGQWGSINVVDAANGQPLWSVGNPNHGVTNLDAFDADGDGSLDLLWGSGYSSSGSDNLYVAALHGPIQWESQEVDGPYLTAVGDVDGDGNPDIVTASFESDSGYGDGIITIYGAATHVMKWQSPSDFFHSFAWTGIHDLKLADLDGDGIQEILVATDRLYDGALYIINGKTHTLKASYLYDDGSPLMSLAVGDADGDGKLDIVAGGGYAHSGSPGRYVYVINPADGTVKWHSYSLGGPITQVAIGNVDGDANPEIVALSDSLFVFDGITHENRQTPSSDYSAFAFSAPNTSGTSAVYGATTTGELRRVFLGLITPKETLIDSLCSSEITSLAAKGRLFFSCGGEVGAYDLNSHSVTALSLPSDAGLGYSHSLAFYQGTKYLVLGGSLGVTQFLYQP